MHGLRLMGGARWSLALVGAVLGVAVLGAGEAGADGPVQLRSRLGDFCLDGPSDSWLVSVVINPCNGTDFQRWIPTPAHQLESVAFPGHCINWAAKFTGFLQPCVDWFSQHLTIHPDGQVTNDTGGCLTVLGGPAPGTLVDVLVCVGDSPGQRWDPVP
ncbi:RICIN domain-containing protein [Mycobacterium spongiae]|uniref:Rv1419 family lectin n=1 Tax=Mycobacterium spongiae TaxID=886343 RepID=UPI001BAAD5D5